jgi:hypothetical protein
MHPLRSFCKTWAAPLSPERHDGVVIPFPAEQDNRQRFNPVPARTADMQAAVLDGKIKADYVKIAVTILQQLKPDRVGNWRTIKPVTLAQIAEIRGCKRRTVVTALDYLKQHFDWFRCPSRGRKKGK